MEGISHRLVETNGIQMHIAEKGAGPLVIMLHGFPEYWYTWRHQLVALADAGFHAVAPDQRGYGESEAPEPIEAYDIFQLVGDVVGLVKALGEERAYLIGHDWGANVTWHCAVLRPDLFPAVVVLSVPFLPRSDQKVAPTEQMKAAYGDKVFYQVYFQEPGRAEADMEANVYRTMRTNLYCLSGDAPPDKRWRFAVGKGERAMDSRAVPDRLPAWLREEDVEAFAAAFQRSGFRGGLNWYRNMDRNWRLTPFLDGVKVRQPTLFIAGAADAVIEMYRRELETMERQVLDLRGKVILPETGHWVNQERAGEVNRLIREFLSGR